MTDKDKNFEEELRKAEKEKELSDKKLLDSEFFVGILAVLILYVFIFIEVYPAYIASWPAWLRVILVVSGIVLFVASVSFCLRVEQTAGYYECRKCGNRYVPKYSGVFFAMHIGRTRYMKCPECGRYSWQKKVISKDRGDTKDG